MLRDEFSNNHLAFSNVFELITLSCIRQRITQFRKRKRFFIQKLVCHSCKIYIFQAIQFS
jgi:hypothetical protein